MIDISTAITGAAGTASVDQAQVYNDLSGLQKITALGKTDKHAALENIAHQFESMMMQMMMKSMREANSVFSDGDITSSSEEKFYQDMFDNQLTLSLSKGKGMGIATAMIRQLQSRFDNSAAKPAADADHNVSDIEHSTAAIASASGTAGKFPSAAIQEAIYRLFNESKSGQDDNANTEAVNATPLDGTPQNFVEKLRPAAERVAQQLGVDSKALLSQSALETGWGQKVLQCPDGSSSFNFFNIKADENWHGAVVTVPTIEYQNGVAVREYAKFRAYDSPEASFADYAKLIGENPRYKQAMDCADDPRAYIKALAQSGYATDPQYAQKVIAVLDSEHISGSSAR
ncbi:MAG: glucosaminidase [Verrucomicrobiaceae bacterium]|nr:glucosaminidase [Verrucomicrobiaceae bacterium]